MRTSRKCLEIVQQSEANSAEETDVTKWNISARFLAYLGDHVPSVHSISLSDHLLRVVSVRGNK